MTVLGNNSLVASTNSAAETNYVQRHVVHHDALADLLESVRLRSLPRIPRAKITGGMWRLVQLIVSPASFLVLVSQSLCLMLFPLIS